MGSDGYRAKDGKRLSVTYCSRGTFDEILQAQLKKVGVEVVSVVLESGAWLAAMHSGEKYHMSGMAGGNPDPIILDMLYFSGNIGKASFQWSVYRGTRVDELP